MFVCVFFFKQKTAYEMRISDWSSDVCSSDLRAHGAMVRAGLVQPRDLQPETADEEALAGNAPVPGPVPSRSRQTAHRACTPALPRPRGNHGAGRRSAAIALIGPWLPVG